jgi:DNA polymerase III alpha subunit
MNVARFEGVEFGSIAIDNLTWNFSVAKNLRVTPGLTGIRGIGEKAAAKIAGTKSYNSIDHFVEMHGKSKVIMEPLIKLGAFKVCHPNSKATWMWYQYRYCTDKNASQLRKEIKQRLSEDWSQEAIDKERLRLADEYHRLWPNRKKTPNKILKWTPPINDSCEAVMALYPIDFSLKEILEFEKHYLGYYWHSPMDLYVTKKGATIESVKSSPNGQGEIEGVVEKIIIGKTKNNKKMARLKMTDGVSNCTIILWQDHIEVLSEYLEEGIGLRIPVNYDQTRDTFTIQRDRSPIALQFRADLI